MLRRTCALSCFDEAQDLAPAELRFFAALAPAKPNGLFLCGDIGQRIFQHPYSWKSLGADVRGRSHKLKVCYRTSQQIRRAADGLLPTVLRDSDGIEDERRGIISVFDGPPPEVKSLHTIAAEAEAVRKVVSGSARGSRPMKSGCLSGRRSLSCARGLRLTGWRAPPSW